MVRKNNLVFASLPIISFFLALLLAYFGYLDFLSVPKKINPFSLTGNYQRYSKNGIFNNQPVSLPPFEYAEHQEKTIVLGDSDISKRIEIDLTNQRIYAYENNKLKYNFLISSGKWGQTPIGRFRIWIKLRYTRMAGGSKLLNTYYNLPNVPYVMYFYNADIPKIRGYGIHGAYWHNNFGHPMSHGCINMDPDEAGILFAWANPDLQGGNSVLASQDNLGTEIFIYGKASPE